MRTVTIPADATELNALMDQARDDDLVVRTSDGSEFLLSPIDDFDHEVERTRNNEKIMTLLDQRGRQTKSVSLSEAKRQLGLSQ